MSLSEAMSGIKLTTTPTTTPRRLVQKALYYDFVLYNMQQKPFGVLLASNGGAIKNIERGFMKHQYNASAPMITIDIVGTLHNTLAMCLKDVSHCNVKELQDSVDEVEELYNDSKIADFKNATKTTPAELYDLLNPGDGDINAAIQKAAREIFSYAPGIQYEGDAVDALVFNGNAASFLDDAAVEAILSILTVHTLKSYPPNHRYNWAKLPRLSIGGHKRRRATKVRARKSKRRVCKRTRRH
jgi:hypothetical protein